MREDTMTNQTNSIQEAIKYYEDYGKCEIELTALSALKTLQDAFKATSDSSDIDKLAQKYLLDKFSEYQKGTQ